MGKMIVFISLLLFYSQLGGPKEAGQFSNELLTRSGLHSGGKGHEKGN